MDNNTIKLYVSIILPHCLKLYNSVVIPAWLELSYAQSIMYIDATRIRNFDLNGLFYVYIFMFERILKTWARFYHYMNEVSIC